jgi:hypothetical protein
MGLIQDEEFRRTLEKSGKITPRTKAQLFADNDKYLIAKQREQIISLSWAAHILHCKAFGGLVTQDEIDAARSIDLGCDQWQHYSENNTH